MQTLCRRPGGREWHTRHQGAHAASSQHLQPPCSSSPTHLGAQLQSERSAEPGSRSNRQLTPRREKGAASPEPGYPVIGASNPVGGAPAVRIQHINRQERLVRLTRRVEPRPVPPSSTRHPHNEPSPRAPGIRTTSPPLEHPASAQRALRSSTRHPHNEPSARAPGIRTTSPPLEHPASAQRALRSSTRPPRNEPSPRAPLPAQPPRRDR
jgi:hypothetical protein